MKLRSTPLLRVLMVLSSGVAAVAFAACADDASEGETVLDGDAGERDGSLPPVDASEVDGGVDAAIDAGDADATAVPQCGADGFCLTESPSASSPAGQAVNLYDAWIDPDGRPYAVGFRSGGPGVILSYEAGSWSVTWAGIGAFTMLWGVGRDELWASNSASMLHGVRKNGVWEWTPMNLPSQAYIGSIWAGRPNEVWACGSGGIFRWDGAGWTTSLARGTAWDRYNSCGKIWGTETGEVWATVQQSVYDSAEEYYKTELYVDRRPADFVPPGDAGGPEDAGTLEGEEIDSISTDGWRIQSATRTSTNGYYGAYYGGGGVHWVIGQIEGRPAYMKSTLENGRVVFGAFTKATDANGASVSGAVINKIWGTPTEAWGIGPLGVYRFDGTAWALARTAINGLPLPAIGTPAGIAGDPTQIVVVGNNIALRREVKP